MRLETKEIVNIFYGLYKLRGHCSVADVAKELEKRGVKTFKGTTPSRQAVHYHMVRSPLGRMLLDVNNVTRRGRDPVYYSIDQVESFVKDEFYVADSE